MDLTCIPGMRHILFKRDVLWLIQRCPEGRTISSLCSPFFLDLVDDDEPVVLRRLHMEKLSDGDSRTVLTAIFQQRTGGVHLFNEIVCHNEDLQRVLKLVPIPDDLVMTDEEWAQQEERRGELEAEQRVEATPWDEDAAKWAELLGSAEPTG